MSSDEANVILEAFDDKFAALIENIDTMIDKKLDPIKEDIRDLKDDMNAVKAAVADLSKEVNQHEDRITELEPHTV